MCGQTLPFDVLALGQSTGDGGMQPSGAVLGAVQVLCWKRWVCKMLPPLFEMLKQCCSGNVAQAMLLRQ